MPAAYNTDRIEMSQRERDIVKVMQPLLQQQRTQAQAAALLGLGVRQVRRLQRKLEAGGDPAVVHGLRGKPSNHQADEDFRRRVVQAYRLRYAGFGPTLASEKLAQEGLDARPQTLRRWLVAEGLWQPRRRREAHRSRRPRRACFGELVQMDASIHDWLEGRGGPVVLVAMIDDATGRVLARFCPEGTTEAHMDLLGRWLRKYGRPLALYTDRHSIFEAQAKGEPLPLASTQFGRALEELGVGLIRAHSPQAKGRVERFFGTAQDRLVKELRLAGAATADEANEVLARFLPAHNRKFAVPASGPADAHRPLGPSHALEAILSIQAGRVVSNDYVVRYENVLYQLLPPPHPGLRGGRVVVERRLDGGLHVRFRGTYLRYREIPGGRPPGGSAPRPPEFGASAADAGGERGEPAPSGEGAGRAGMQPAGERSGCAPAEPYPLAGAGGDSAKAAKRQSRDPFRRPIKRQK
jgi:hypothetical protein